MDPGLDQLFNPGLKEYSHNDGNNGALIVDQGHRNSQEVHSTAAAPEGCNIGMDQRRGNGHADIRVGSEFLACGMSKENGQEVKHTVCQGEEKGVGSAFGRKNAQGSADDQNTLQKTGCHKGSDKRKENAGNGIDRHVQNCLFLFSLIPGGFFFIGLSCSGENAGLSSDLVIDLGDICSDDHLVLTGCLQDL